MRVIIAIIAHKFYIEKARKAREMAFWKENEALIPAARTLPLKGKARDKRTAFAASSPHPHFADPPPKGGLRKTYSSLEKHSKLEIFMST